MFLKEK